MYDIYFDDDFEEESCCMCDMTGVRLNSEGYCRMCAKDLEKAYIEQFCKEMELEDYE